MSQEWLYNSRSMTEAFDGASVETVTESAIADDTYRRSDVQCVLLGHERLIHAAGVTAVLPLVAPVTGPFLQITPTTNAKDMMQGLLHDEVSSALILEHPTVHKATGGDPSKLLYAALQNDYCNFLTKYPDCNTDRHPQRTCT